MAIQRSTLVTKAQELMNTEWLDYATAAKRAKEAMTTTTPVQQAPVTPAPVVPTPAPITPAPIVNAPVDQTTGLSKPLEPVSQPVQPAPIPTPAQPVSTPKIDTTPWITQDAFQQAKAESEKIKAQNDAVMAQNQQKAELARQDEAMKAEALIPKDEKWVLNALISGASVPKQNTQAYRNAEFKANNFRKFNSMTPTQLLDNLKQGQISSEMDQLLSQNPNYTQAKQKLNEQQKITNLNKTMTNIVNWVKWKEVATTTPEQDEEDISIKLMQKYGLDDANAQAFSQFVATDEEMADNKAKLLANRNQLSSVNRQIADATKLFNDWVSQLKKDYPNISASAIITLMWSRLGEFNDAITNLNSTKKLLQADIKDEMDLAKSAYDAKTEDIKSQNEIRKAMALNEYKAEFDKQQAEQALNDPATAIKSVMDEYKKLGIPFTSTVQSRLAEFKASGKPLEQFLTEMSQNIQASPAYQKYQALQQGQMSDVQKMTAQQNFDIQKIKLQDSMKDKNIQRVGWTDSNPIYWYMDGNKLVTVSVPWSTSTWTTPTGNIVPVTAGNKTVRLDQVGAGGFENAVNQASIAGIPLVFRNGVAGARDQVATIKSMADRLKVPFNASNPAETAAKLRAMWNKIADPWKSNHESGMAIDVYWNSKLDPVSPEQERILNANGWYSAGIPWDAGHFEYRGGTTWTETSQIEKDATLERIRRGQVTDSELGKIQQKAIAGWWGTDFKEALKKWMKTTLTDTQIKGLATVDDKIQKDTVLDNVNLVSQQKETIKWLLNTDINANWFNDIALINAFQKIVDPGVSVKEWDVSLLQSSIALKDRLNPSNLLSKVQAGTKLTPETRKQMLDSTVAIYNAQADFGNDLMKKKYYKLADNYGINLADYWYSYDKIDSKWKTIKPISEILPWATGFKSFMSELTTLLQ